MVRINRNDILIIYHDKNIKVHQYRGINKPTVEKSVIQWQKKKSNGKKDIIRNKIKLCNYGENQISTYQLKKERK